jgi:phage gpG-like protein
MASLTKKHGGNAGAALREAVAHALAGGMKGNHPVSAIPARPFLIIQPEDEQEIRFVFTEWLDERVRAAWPPGVG